MICALSAIGNWKIGLIARQTSRGGGEVGMMETYFAIRVYAFYAMLAALVICGIILLVIVIKQSKRR